MATLYITEYADMIRGPLGSIQIAKAPMLAKQTVAIGGSSVQSAAFNSGTKIIRVSTDAICSVAVGAASPTATATDARMPADSVEYWGVEPGDKLAVITNT